MGTIKKLFKNAYSFSVISKCISVVVGFLFTIFQSRYLGSEIKGQIAAVNSIVSISSVVLGFGIYQAYPYYKRKGYTNLFPVFMRIALLLLALYTGLSAAAVLLFRLPAKYLAVFIITPLITYNIIISYITLIEEPLKKSMVDVCANLLEMLLLIALWILARPSFLIGVVIITFKDFVKAIYFTAMWRRQIHAPADPIGPWIPRLVRFGFFPMLLMLMTTLNYRVDVLMLNERVTDAAVGIYSVGVLLAERIWMIPDALKGVMESHLAKGKDARETAYVIRMCNSACLVVALFIILLGKPFMDLAFGPEYDGAYTVTLILLAGVFSMNYFKLITSYNIVMGKQAASVLMLGAGVVVNIVANLILIPRMGINGAGLASVISYTICSALFILYFRTVSGIGIRQILLMNRTDLSRLKERLGKRKKGSEA